MTKILSKVQQTKCQKPKGFQYVMDTVFREKQYKLKQFYDIIYCDCKILL